MIRYLTAGDSHGPQLGCILGGVPAGLKIDMADVNNELRRRQKGYGRGKRMGIEKDEARILSGLSNRVTTGAPLLILVENKDWKNWKDKGWEDTLVSHPRPGHADLAGILKYNLSDVRPVMERASARETVCRVAAGAICKALLREFSINILSYVKEIGGFETTVPETLDKKVIERIEKSPISCPDIGSEKKIIDIIKKAQGKGDSLGGIFAVIVRGCPPGLGSFAQWDLKLDARIARAVMSIQGVKGVGIGSGFESARFLGSQFHDEILYRHGKGYIRKSNNAGGIEGGMSNGEDILIEASMKPIATLKRPLRSVDIITKKSTKAQVERADVCAVPACSVIAEAVIAIEIANALVEKFGQDSLLEIRKSYREYFKRIKK